MTPKRNRSGGAAAGGGFGFHAHLGAIAAIHTLRGTPVQWTEGLTAAAPYAVSFETSGPGDDLALELTDGSTVEIQARKGLRADQRFWTALFSLFEGIRADRCSYGLLIVCPNSSTPVRERYALALKRIGEGRNDGASREQSLLTAHLAENDYDAEEVCARLRIQTVAALDDARDAIGTAHAELGHVCADRGSVRNAWDALCTDALSAIARRGRRTVRSLSARLRASQIRLADTAKDSPVAINSRLLQCTMSGTEYFEVPGISQLLPTDRAWLPLTALVRDAPVEPASSLEEALTTYRALSEKPRSGGEKIASSTIGTFRRLCVVVGGPGSGKSLLLRVLAREFAKDSFVGIHVRLRDLATRMRATGCAVEEGLLQLGLDGTGVSRQQLRAASLPELVLLCDGLDECGDRQDDVASGLREMSAAYPSYRIVVTTRPIGYSTRKLDDWRHYDLVPLAEEDTAEHLETLCRCVVEERSESMPDSVPDVGAYLEEGGTARLLGRSPLLLTLGAAVLLEWGGPSKSKLELYERLFQLVEGGRPARNTGTGQPVKAVLSSVRNHLGWLTSTSPLADAEELESHCARRLQQNFGATPLQAFSEVETCVGYWEEKGLIERLRHSGTELIAFVHKTFGEYSAALHLAQMDPDEARQLIGEALFRPDWDEILDLSAEAQLANMLAKLFVAKFETVEADESELIRVVGVLVRPGVSLSAEERSFFLGRVCALAQSEDRRSAYRVGLALTEHDLSCIPEAGEMASSLVSDSKEWSRLVGWAVLACHFPERVSREALEEALRHFMQRSHATDFFVRGASRFPFGVVPDRRVFENFMIGALRSLLAGGCTAYQDKLIAEVWVEQPKATVDFADRFESLLRDLGREDAPPAPWKAASAGFLAGLDFSRFDEIGAGLAAILTDVVPSAFLGGTAGPPPATGPKCLAALVGLAGALRVPVGDESVWLSDRCQLDAVHRLLRAASYVFDLPAERLAAEARQTFASVDSARRQQRVNSKALGVLPDVDASEVDWCRAQRVDIDSDLLERLVRHRSQWVRELAARFLDARLHGDERREACERILEAGSGSALHLAGALTAELPDGSEVLIRRLEGRAVVGLQYLFDCLEEQGCRVSASHLAALENGLINCGVKTAVSAARWCEARASNADGWLVDLLRSASSYWVDNEKPYPESGGAVPDSPREALLRTQCMIAMPAFCELSDLARDPRPDVARAAIDGIVELATSSPEDKVGLVEGILGKTFSPGQCETLLRSGVQYDEEELSMLCGLCGDSDPAYRSAAVRGVLNHPRMDRKKALALADTMRSDENGNVRDAVHRFLEEGEKERR